MVGMKEPLSALKEEYENGGAPGRQRAAAPPGSAASESPPPPPPPAGSQVFVRKIESLEGSYSAIRRTRGGRRAAAGGLLPIACSRLPGRDAT
jgi:hypothetical protein